MTTDSPGSARENERIDPSSDDDIRRLAEELGVSSVAVLDAVNKVGPKVADIRQHLDQAMAGGQADA